jgi:hypothetical protein
MSKVFVRLFALCFEVECLPTHCAIGPAQFSGSGGIDRADAAAADPLRPSACRHAIVHLSCPRRGAEARAAGFACRAFFFRVLGRPG